jgi:hypothetical protein
MQLGPGSRIAAWADRVLKPSQCFRRPTRSAGVRSIEGARRSPSGADAASAVAKPKRSPECLGVRVSATVTAPERALMPLGTN